MNAIQKITCAGLVLASLCGGAPAWAAEVGRDFALGVNEANAKLRGGDVDGALEQYAGVRELAPESADLSYNMAVAQYRKGDVAAAEQLFQAAATSENDALAANARYNLGNCNYASGLELSQQDRLAAIEQLESAIDNYRSALDVDSSNADARANIELAARLIDKLREEQQQDRQQQQHQQNQQQDDQQQSSDQQRNNQQQNSQDRQQKQDQQSQDQQEQDQQQQNDQQQNQQQNSESSQGDEQQEQQDQQQQSGKGQQPQEHENQSQQDQSRSDESQGEQSKSEEQEQQETQQEESQSESQQQQNAQARDQQQQNQSSQQGPQQQQPQNASSAEESKEDQGQQPPPGELTAASEEQAKDAKDKRPIAVFDPSKDGEMTQQEAEKMLQAIRDRDMLRRLRRQAEAERQHVPVDRDW